MASVETNSRDVGNAIRRVADALNLRRPTPDGMTLGRTLATAVAGAIAERTAERQVQPDGEPLPALSEKYRRRKVSAGLDERILVATDEMLQPDQVRGEVAVTRDTVTMTAGLTEDVKQKVHYAEEGSDTRPVRHFYEPGEAGDAAADGVLAGAIDAAIREVS